MTGVKQKCVGYVRVSTSKQDISPEAQRDTITRWAQLNDIRVLGVYSDVCSGSTPWMERPGLADAVAELKRSGAVWLVTAKADRLSRDLYNTLHLQRDIAAFGAQTISCTENPEDTTTPERELMRQMLASFAQFERAMIRGRIKAALDLRKRQGVKLGALPLEDTELGRCIVWAIWTFADQDMGARAIAAKLNEMGIVGPRGGAQHFRNVQRILKRPRPTVMPRAWRGIKKTWEAFYGRDRQQSSRPSRSSGTAADHSDSGKARRPATSGGAAAPAGEAHEPDLTTGRC